MSDQSAPSARRMGAEARAMMLRAARADARAQDALKAAIDDSFLAPEMRLDERTRVTLRALLDAMVEALAGELAERGGRALAARGEAALAEALAGAGEGLSQRLAAAGLLRDSDLIDECLARVRLELLAAALPLEAPGEPETPSLLVRLTQSPDRVVAAAASAVLMGESHRRAPAEGARLAGTGLSTTLHQRLLWWVAAGLRERAIGDDVDGDPLDRALAEAALRNIAAHDDGERLEAAAMRLAAAIDASADELPALLDEALRDRRPIVFVALLAHALGARLETVRALVLEPAADRLWLVLRAFDLPRDAIARAGFRLCEADARRDIEAFADMLDRIMAIDPIDARRAVSALSLHPEYRAALRALDAAA